MTYIMKLRFKCKGVNYPSLPVEQSNCVHQFDVVGPRYLKTDGRFYSAILIWILLKNGCLRMARSK